MESHTTLTIYLKGWDDYRCKLVRIRFEDEIMRGNIVVIEQ
jgi:hypothetical protein